MLDHNSENQDLRPPILERSIIRGRLAVVALVGVVPISWFVQWSDLRVGGTMVAGPYPPLAACLLWAVLVVAVRTIRAKSKLDLLTRDELLFIFGVWACANVVSGRGTVHALLTSIAGPIYYARGTAVVQAIKLNLPNWLALTDRSAAVHFFEGYGVKVPWLLWRAPLVVWSLFMIPFLLTNVCLCALFERIWVVHERLAFPLALLPIEALSWNGTHNAAFKRVFVAGLTIPILLHFPGAAHAYFPAFPCVSFFNDVSYLVSELPWSVMKPLYFNFYPFIIGITFLAPTDITLSVWFFLLLSKLELLIAFVTGWSEGVAGGTTASPPFLEEQSAGAYIAIACLLIWTARRPITAIVRSLGGLGAVKCTSAERLEALELRPYLVGFLVGVTGLLVWCVVTGLPIWFSIAYFGFYAAVALVLSRIMAESGISWLLAPILPDKLVLSMTGSMAVSQSVLTRLVVHVQHLRDTRQMLAPSILHAGRLKSESPNRSSGYYALLFVVLLVALGVGVPCALQSFYTHGALSMTQNSDGVMMTANVIPTTAINQLSSRLSTPIKPSPSAALAVFAGACMTLALSALRLRCVWWPLNPIGYALTGTLQVGYANKMVLSIVIGWFLKSVTLRFGGARGFRLLRAAALGLIFGDLLIGGILKLLDATVGPSGYAIF